LVDFAHERTLEVWHWSKQWLDLSSYIQPRSTVINPGVHDLHSAFRTAWSAHMARDSSCHAIAAGWSGQALVVVAPFWW
jgi:hypothetical protein